MGYRLDSQQKQELHGCLCSRHCQQLASLTASCGHACACTHVCACTVVNSSKVAERDLEPCSAETHQHAALDSTTAAAVGVAWALNAVRTSARVGAGLFTMDSSMFVATMTGFPRRLQWYDQAKVGCRQKGIRHVCRGSQVPKRYAWF